MKEVILIKNGELALKGLNRRTFEDVMIKNMRRKLSELTGKQVILETQIDADLIGGIRLRYEGVQLDGSLRSRLDALRRNLADAIV